MVEHVCVHACAGSLPKLIGPQASPVSISPEMGVGTSLCFAFPMGADRGRGV